MQAAGLSTLIAGANAELVFRFGRQPAISLQPEPLAAWPSRGSEPICPSTSRPRAASFQSFNLHGIDSQNVASAFKQGHSLARERLAGGSPNKTLRALRISDPTTAMLLAGVSFSRSRCGARSLRTSCPVVGHSVLEPTAEAPWCGVRPLPLCARQIDLNHSRVRVKRLKNQPQPQATH